MSKESTDRKYVAWLAVAAGLILVLGVWARPPKVKTAQDDSVVISPLEALRLERVAQRRSLEDMADFFSTVAAEAATHLVRLKETEATAICWDGEGTLVSALSGSRHYPSTIEVETSDGRKFEAQTGSRSPLVPLFSLRTSPQVTARPIRALETDLVLTGEWIVVVFRRADGRYGFAPATYGGSAEAPCGEVPLRQLNSNLHLTEAMLGGGVFDLDGNLLGIVARCSDRLTIVASGSVRGILDQADSLEGQLLSRYGFRVEAVPAEDAGDSGPASLAEIIMVTEVWNGTSADQAGLLPSDRLVDLDGHAVEKMDDLVALLLPVAREVLEIGVLRGGRTLHLSTKARAPERPTPPPGGALHGLEFGAAREGFLIDSVAVDSRAARAGLRSGDRVLYVDGVGVRNVRELTRALTRRADRPVYVVAERGDRKKSFLLR